MTTQRWRVAWQHAGEVNVSRAGEGREEGRRLGTGRGVEGRRGVAGGAGEEVAELQRPLLRAHSLLGLVLAQLALPVLHRPLRLLNLKSTKMPSKARDVKRKEG